MTDELVLQTKKPRSQSRLRSRGARTFARDESRGPADLTVLSLGAGVQSTALTLLILDGTVKCDFAVFADTQWEPLEVYDHLRRLQAECERRQFPLHVVSTGSLREDALDPERNFATMPLYRERDGRAQMGQRQCTNQYKVRPIRRFIRKELGPVGNVDLLMGISTDEWQRMRDSDVKYIRNVYPLIELGWSRQDCKDYLSSQGWDAPRSACIGCPFHSDQEWRDIRADEVSWADAVDFDEKIRHKGYLHRSLRPLTECALSPEEGGQLNMFEAECQGYCGV